MGGNDTTLLRLYYYPPLERIKACLAPDHLSKVQWGIRKFEVLVRNDSLDLKLRRAAASCLCRFTGDFISNPLVLIVELKEDEEIAQVKEIPVFQEELGKGVYLTLVSIPAGQFMMAASEDDPQGRESERPTHSVSVQSFWLGQAPVTQAQWEAVSDLPKVERDIEPNPSRYKGRDLPVESVSWYDAVEFCKRLSIKTGSEYRLPSEAEWEYACRAGTTTPYHFGETISTDLANYKRHYIRTTEAGKFGVANNFGLYDMHGNVFEWCQDHWHDNYEGAPTDGSAWISSDQRNSRVYRGGSWDFNPWICRSAYRGRDYPGDRNDDTGFRVCCSPPRSLL